MRAGVLACLICIVALAAGAQPQAAQQIAVSDIRLYAMNCGDFTTTDAGSWADDGAYDGVSAKFVAPCYLIRHPKGDLLWDTGVAQELADVAPEGRMVSPTFRESLRRKLTDQLAEIGVRPGDVEFVSVSHSHGDHIGNAVLFPGATWIVDADERAYVFRPEMRANAERFAGVAALERFKTKLIQGDGDYDVFGDGSVTIIQAPGHTPGHCVLLVRLAQSGPVLLTGDLWHFPEDRVHHRVPRGNTDRAQTLRSMDKVERIAKETGARVVIEHYQPDLAAFPAFPAYLR